MANKSKVVEKFLKEVKDEKIKQMMGVVLDTSYWKSIAEGVDEEKLRKQLVEERDKGKDKADLQVIQNIQTLIDNNKKAEQELVRLGQLRKAITVYMKYVNEEDEGLLAELEEMTKL